MAALDEAWSVCRYGASLVLDVESWSRFSVWMALFSLLPAVWFCYFFLFSPCWVPDRPKDVAVKSPKWVTLCEKCRVEWCRDFNFVSFCHVFIQLLACNPKPGCLCHLQHILSSAEYVNQTHVPDILFYNTAHHQELMLYCCFCVYLFQEPTQRSLQPLTCLQSQMICLLLTLM